MTKQNHGGRPSLEPGPRGKPSPRLSVRIGRSALARLKRDARRQKIPVGQLVRYRLGLEGPDSP